MRKAKGVLYVVMTLTLAVVLAGPAGAQFGGDRENVNRTLDITVDPESFEFTIVCNEAVGDQLCITTPPSGVIRAADIVFLFDATNSMHSVIEQVKTSAVTIMQDIIDLGIDAAFGAGYFKDYPALNPWSSCGYSQKYGTAPDVPWVMLSDITTNIAAVAAAIGTITTAPSDNDGPEDYARALYEARDVADGGSFNYRFDTRRIVIIFGDAPPHDCDFIPTQSYGWDPGPNAIIEDGGGDDIDYQTAVANLASDGVAILALDASIGSASLSEHATTSFLYMVEQTDGAYFLITQASQVPDAILDLIGEIAIIDVLSLVEDPEVPYDAWLTESPLTYEQVGPEQTVCFDIEITVPLETPVGDYQFDLLVDADGETVATVPVLVHRTGASATENVTWSKIREMYRSAE
jgi:hypothetical protein